MKDVDPDRLLIFLHIPKAAGNTIKMIVRRQVGDRAVFATEWGPAERRGASRTFGIHVGYRMNPDDIWYPESIETAIERFQALPEEDQHRVRVIDGFHMEYGIHELLNRNSSYFTLLRNPVDRVLSHYFYTILPESRPTGHALYEHITEKIESNLQTKIVAGPHDNKVPMTEAEMLERAKSNLRSMAVAGLAERFDETVLLLSRTFGWKVPVYERLNVNRIRPVADDVPESVRARIEASNHLDFQLYSFAKELFVQQLDGYGPRIEKDLRHLRAMNAWWGLWWRTKRRYYRMKKRFRRLNSFLCLLFPCTF